MPSTYGFVNVAIAGTTVVMAFRRVGSEVKAGAKSLETFPADARSVKALVRDATSTCTCLHAIVLFMHDLCIILYD